MTSEALITERRAPLTKARVLQAAVARADRDGIDALSMRKLGKELGVEGMALYRHVRGKDELLNGIVDAVVGEIRAPRGGDDWKTDMRALALAARQVMLRHTWAPRVLVDRQEIGPATLGHIDTVLGILSAGGFSIDMAHHALHVLGSRILGFTQDPFNDSADPRPSPEEALRQANALAVHFPNVGELALAATHEGALGGCDDDFEFEFSLDLILDGLDRRRTAG
jgi:AcrR family transcriptional regulator